MKGSQEQNSNIPLLAEIHDVDSLMLGAVWHD